MAKVKVLDKNEKGVLIVDNKTGKEKVLLNPRGKREKFKVEMKNGIHITNRFEEKLTKNGDTKRLTDLERAYRAGYLDAGRDSAKAYASKTYKSAE